METNPLISSVNQWTAFYMITASVIKELRLLNVLISLKPFTTFSLADTLRSIPQLLQVLLNKFL